MNSDGTEKRNLTNNPAYDSAGTWSPDGSKIVFRSDRDGNTEVYTMNGDGSNLRNISENATSADWQAVWSPDSTKVAFRSGTDPSHTEIYVVNSDGTNKVRLLSSRVVHYMSMSWSLDSSRIAFHIDNGTSSRIFVANADGTGLAQLSKNNENDFGPIWSPDGSKIAFSSYRGRSIDLYVMNANGSNERLLSNLPDAADEDPVWSPDGSRIVFTARYSLGDEQDYLYAVNADGTSLVKLTANEPLLRANSPAWSPDSKKIAFDGYFSTRTSDVFIINSNGTNLTNLTNGPPNTSNSFPQWSPNGSKILFASLTYDNGVTSVETDIYIMNPDGSDKVNLTNTPHVQESPFMWQPEIKKQQQKSVTIETKDVTGASVKGVWTAVYILTNQAVPLVSGYTPFMFQGNDTSSYIVIMANYDGKVFDRWQDNNSTQSSRIITLTSNKNMNMNMNNVTLTATYNTGNSLRGFTPLTYLGTAEHRPALTVNAVLSENNRVLNMWTIIDPQSTNATGTTYKVYATDGYQNLKFDHWADNGSTDRIRTLTVGKVTTITAYYRTG